ncbi:BlaI/MecI/CopY family transcriptional regulator [candidate division KSB1 bacterium]|nr:BlaI/MecI/CopY family transcriptional regulator [candidate division KSB1 bacterium]MBL7094343.1 BlaI/MecI/CopY family transcriptional regulator [candidate division KSB1 bacterium]
MRLSESEWQIMNALWQRYPASARELIERLPKNINWAYTTLKTMLTRLVAKNVVSERKRANTSIYEPLITRSKARRNALQSLMDQAFDGAMGPLMHFLIEDQKLSKKQRQELLQLLQNENSEK